MTILSGEEWYEKIKKFIESNDGILITTLDEFLNLRNNVSSYNQIKLKIVCPKCGDIFIRTYSNYRKPDRKKICSKCSRKGSRLLSEKDILEVLKEKELKLITPYSEYKSLYQKIDVMCKCGNITNTTIASIKASGSPYLCPDCKSKKLRETFSHDYEYVYNYFKDTKCELLSKEYINAITPLKYVATCGHVTTGTFHAFKKQKFHMCIKCVKRVNDGENAYNWKGGMYKYERDHFSSTFESKKWTSDIYKRDNYTCQCCGKRGHKLNAHHLDGYNWCVEKRIDINNGITLCEDCHKEFHKMYGYGDNTKEQFEEWVLNKNY